MEAQEAPTTATAAAQPGRVLIAERTQEQRRRLDTLKKMAAAAAELAPLYADLELGEFDAAALADAYKTGGADTLRRYLDHAKEEAQKIGNKVLRGSLMAQIETTEPPYITKARETKRKADADSVYLLGYLDVTAQGATLTDKGAARLAEDTRLYTTDPEEIAKWRQHTAAIDALNALFEDGAALPPLWFNLFELDPQSGKFSLPKDGTNYAYFVQRGKEAAGMAAAAPEASDDEPETTVQPTEREQHNRAKATAPRMVKGIAKAPDQRDRGAEMRQGKHRVSPDSPE